MNQASADSTFKLLPDSDFFTKQFYFFTGKGGVGKTTLSLATARALASRGRRTLWIEMSDSPRGSHAFPAYTGAYEAIEAAPNLFMSRVTLQPALDEYMALIFKLQVVANRISQNSFFQTLTQALPGLESLVMLGKIEYELNRKRGGRRYWDSVVLDAPATGHALTLLRFPLAAKDIVPMGPVLDAAEKQRQILGDPQRTAILITTLAEELPVTESIELIDGLNAIKCMCHGIFVNGLFMQDPANADTQLLHQHASEEAVSERCNFLSGWHKLQQKELQRLQEKCAHSQTPMYKIPFVGGTLADQTSWIAKEIQS